MPGMIDFLRGAAGGAGAGTPFGPVGTAIGAFTGGVLSLFGETPEQTRARRKAELLKQIAFYKQKTLTEGVAKINKFVTGQVKNAQQGAAKRALSLGRQGEAEAFITPAVSNVTERGANATENFVSNVTRQYDSAALGVEQDWADRPIDPSLTDVVEGLGIAGLQYDASQKRIEAMKLLYGQDEKPSGGNTTPTSSLVSPVQIGELPESQNRFPLIAPLTQTGNALKPRKSTSMVDMYRNLIGR